MKEFEELSDEAKIFVTIAYTRGSFLDAQEDWLAIVMKVPLPDNWEDEEAYLENPFRQEAIQWLRDCETERLNNLAIRKAARKR